MILDGENRYSNAQELSASGASTDYIDHGVVSPNLGAGEPMCVVLALPIVPTSNDGTETYTAVIQVDSETTFSSPVSIGQTVTIPRAATAGTVYVIPIPSNAAWERYSRMYFTLGGDTPVLTIDALLLPLNFVQNYTAYADAITISA